MGKKCIPGVICMENMTLFVLLVVIVLVVYLIVRHTRETQSPKTYTPSSPYLVTTSQSLIAPQAPIYSGLGGLSTRYQQDPINDPYSPPFKTDGMVFPPTRTIDVRGLPPPVLVGGGCGGGCAVGVPVNVQTNQVNTAYSQVGILTKELGGIGGMPVILPLMGRSLWNGRDKWQYYTMANAAATAVNTKLPIKVNGRSCTGEYGCDSITTGDMVYVEGYGDVFRATIYENASLAYLPV
jgi:hypothetical protein